MTTLLARLVPALLIGTILTLASSCNGGFDHPAGTSAPFELRDLSPKNWFDTPVSDKATARALAAHFDSSAQVVDWDGWTDATREVVRTYYANRGYTPAWLDDGKLRPHARALVTGICGTDNDENVPALPQGLALVNALHRFAETPSDSSAAALDLELTAAFMRYSRDLLRGRVDPKTLASGVYLEVPQIPLDSVLATILTRDEPESLESALMPSHPHYRRLQAALSRYRELAAKGGWSQIASGEVIKPDDHDPRVPDLRHRLAVTGDLRGDPAATDSLFDTDVQEAVARFQLRHGLEADSVLGPASIEALNVPIEYRIHQIELTLERWRWLPRQLGERYVIVNIPAFFVNAYEGDDLVLSMKAVVGAELEGRQTPVFSDRMEYVVFRPYWNVPEEITLNEILPLAEEDESYLEDSRYEIVDENGEVVPLHDADLDKVASGSHRIRQLPGPNNSLGLVKFMLPNRHNVYLHDTPADHLFEESERDFSHGCVRLEDPVRFAQFVLGPQGWTRRDIEAALDSDQERVDLETYIPVYLMYLSAFVGEDGTVSFRNDLYGFDESLSRALDTLDDKQLSQAASCEQVHEALEEL